MHDVFAAREQLLFAYLYGSSNAAQESSIDRTGRAYGLCALMHISSRTDNVRFLEQT